MSDRPPPSHRPYGGPPSGRPPRDPDERPGTVTAAGVITMIFSASALVGCLLLAGLAAAARPQMVAAMEREVSPEHLRQLPGEEAAALVIAILLLGALWSLVALVLGALVRRRSNAVRLALAVSAALCAVLSLVAIASVVSALPLAASVAVLVLLFTGGANDWFARAGRRAPTGRLGG